MRRWAQGIAYPKDFVFKPDTSKQQKGLHLPLAITVPHRADALERIGQRFSEISGMPVERIFILAPLHKGKLDFAGNEQIYTWEGMEHVEGAVENDDVCSEEYCAEMLLPFCEGTFPGVPVQAFFATGKTDKTEKIVNNLLKGFPKSLFIVSNNSDTNCAAMWRNGVIDDLQG